MARKAAMIVLVALAAFAILLTALRNGARSSAEQAIAEQMSNYYSDQRASLATASRGWDSLVTPVFTLYMPRTSFAAQHSAQYQTDVDSAIHRALDMLNEKTYPAHLRVYYVGSREEMKAAIGESYSGNTDAEDHSVVLVASDSSRPPHDHEIMHAVSLVVWGQPGSADGDASYPTAQGLYGKGGWMREGIASAAGDHCGEFTYRAIAAQMHAQGEQIALDSLRSAFYVLDGLAAYIQAGSLVQYLLSQYDVASFRKLWRSAGSDFEGAYGKNAATIEAEWTEWLRAVPDSLRPPSIKEFRESGCT